MRKQPIDISVANQDDLPAVLQLYQAAGITASQAYTLTEAQQQWARFALYPFYRLFVARLRDEVVGTFELLVMENLAKAGAKTAIVEDVAVDPTVQGHGIGKAMMQHACKVAAEQGCYKLMLSSNLKRTQAHAFYDALGFERHGVSFVIQL